MNSPRVMAPRTSLQPQSIIGADDNARTGEQLAFWTLCYLSFSFLLWSVLWLRPSWALLVCTLVVSAIFVAGREAFGGEKNVTPFWKVRFFPVILGSLWVFASINGVGGFGPQTTDWFKHNSVLADLVRLPWPVRYGPQEQFHLSYYIGFYLPAAWVGKAFGWTGANVALLLWTWLGMVPLAGFLALQIPKWWAGFLFLVWSGADWLGTQIFVAFSTGVWLSKGTLLQFSNEYWLRMPATMWAFASPTSLLAYVPQHAIGAWLGIAAILRFLPTNANRVVLLRSSDWLILAILPFWSPFGWLGCLPFAVARLFMGRTISTQPVSNRSSKFVVSIASGASFALIGAFLTSRLPLPPGVVPLRGHSLTFTLPGALREQGALHLVEMLFFALVEWLLITTIACWILRRHAPNLWHRWKPVVGVACATLLVLPFFQYGTANDLFRISIAPLFALMLATSQALLVAAPGRSLRVARSFLLLLLLVGSSHFLSSVRGAASSVRHKRFVSRAALSEVPDIYSAYSGGKWLAARRNYVGPNGSVFGRVFLKGN